MLFGNRIEHCPFVPFVIPHPKTVDYRKISKVLEFEDQKPHLIFLANSSFEEPPNTDFINIHILYFRSYTKPKSTYYDFLDLCFEIIANYPNNKIPYIGVASRSSPDFCGFFIARWLFNECGYQINESLELVRKSILPGITKDKFLTQLSKLYYKIEPKAPVKIENNSTETNNENTENLTKTSIKENEPMTTPDQQETNKPTETIIKEPQSNEKIIEKSEPRRLDEIKQTELIPVKKEQPQPQPQQIQKPIEESRPKPQSSEISSSSSQQQIQIQRQQQQILLSKLQGQAQQYYQYQNQIKMRLQEFQSHPYEYQQQNISYQIQLQNNLKEAQKFLEPIEIQIQQIQANQQQQQQQIQQQQQQLIQQMQPKQASTGLQVHPDLLAVENDMKVKQEESIISNANITANNSASMQTLIQSQPQIIEQPVPPQHVTMYFNEIKKMMNVPNKKRLFTKFAPMTLSQLEMIKNMLLNDPRKNDSNALTYCLMPEPEGIRAILYLRRKIPILIFKEFAPIQLKLDINTNDDDLFIFEANYVRYAQSSIVLCDVMFAKDEDVSSRPFNYRIGIVKNCYEKIFKQLNSSVIKFTIRPFYKLKDYRLLTDLFTNKPHKQFSRYPLVGISATLINSRNCHVWPCMYLWTNKIIENPRVLIEIDFGSKVVLGFAQCGTTSAIIAYLGKLTPDMFDLNGKVVEIEVLDQDPARPQLLNAKIIRPSDKYPWTTEKFLKYYPDREPHMDVQVLNSMLEKLASVA